MRDERPINLRYLNSINSDSYAMMKAAILSNFEFYKKELCYIYDVSSLYALRQVFYSTCGAWTFIQKYSRLIADRLVRGCDYSQYTADSPISEELLTALKTDCQVELIKVSNIESYAANLGVTLPRTVHTSCQARSKKMCEKEITAEIARHIRRDLDKTLNKWLREGGE